MVISFLEDHIPELPKINKIKREQIGKPNLCLKIDIEGKTNKKKNLDCRLYDTLFGFYSYF